MGLSNLEIVLGIGSILSTGIAVYVGLKVDPLKESLAAETKQREKDKEEFDKRLVGFNTEIRAERDKMDRRISDIEKTYVSRIELASTVKDIVERMERGISRVEDTVKQVGEKVDHLADRLVKVEAGG